MKRFFSIMAATALFAVLAAVPAQASFGLSEFDVTFTNSDGSTAVQAGSHPYAMTTSVQFNSTPTGEGGRALDEAAKDIFVGQVSGFVGDPNAIAPCSTADFLTRVNVRNFFVPDCPDSSTLGIAAVTLASKTTAAPVYSAVYNLDPPPHVAAKIGFWTGGVPVAIELGVSDSPPYEVYGGPTNISQVIEVVATTLTLWGVPASDDHDPLRGHCLMSDSGGSAGNCPANVTERPFLTLPRSCEGPLLTHYAADSWMNRGARLSNGWPDLADSNWVTGSVFTHDNGEPPSPRGMYGCGKLGFSPSIAAKPTTKAASSPTGLDFSLDVNNEGLSNPTGLADSDIRKAVVTLPEGFSANPSLAEGLNVCTETDLARETAFSEPGAGCPNASKIGTVEVETPLLDENVNGALFIAKPYENPFNSLLAMYLVIKNANLGIVVRQPLEVIPDPVTGQLTTVADELPQLPFSHFKLHFREGARSPLASPPACGTYKAKAVLSPWSGGPPITTTSAFQIITGPNEGPCPSGGLPPFKPGLIAGTINNRAGSFSPFNLRMFRSDSEQEITRFSIKLPPGITGKLAGIPYCTDAQIAAAKARTGPHGGQEELDSPSCPKASEIGRTLAGAGVGPSLTYAPGKIYLAGPYNGSNLSMVAITAGVVGPFDIGTVVIRQAFKIDPETAEVFIDSTGSDPIPHIIRGIPVHLRDIRAYVDKPDFVLNPTDCSATSTASTVLGSGLDFVSDADNNPVTVTSRFQAADCAALAFKPQLSMKLTGGTKRGAHPAFSAHLAMNGIGESGIATAQVTLPKSEFIENAHFDTICTRVQFKAGAGNGAECPAGSAYGRARAVTPILSEPLTGPVFLRSSEHQLPDLVIALSNSQVDFNLVGRVDSVDGKLRNTFETAPDAPVSSFDIELAGGKKGLFVNSTNLCAKKRYATAAFTGQNGKAYESKPELKVKCKKPRKPKKGKAAKRKHRAQLQISHAHRAGR
jgi:hypothetical protein